MAVQFYHFAESTMLERIMDYLRHTVFFPLEKRSAFAAQVAKQDLREQLPFSAVKTLASS